MGLAFPAHCPSPPSPRDPGFLLSLGWVSSRPFGVPTPPMQRGPQGRDHLKATWGEEGRAVSGSCPPAGSFASTQAAARPGGWGDRSYRAGASRWVQGPVPASSLLCHRTPGSGPVVCGMGLSVESEAEVARPAALASCPNSAFFCPAGWLPPGGCCTSSFRSLSVSHKYRGPTVCLCGGQQSPAALLWLGALSLRGLLWTPPWRAPPPPRRGWR